MKARKKKTLHLPLPPSVKVKAIAHARDCPVAKPDFVPADAGAKPRCTCDFLARLRAAVLELEGGGA